MDHRANGIQIPILGRLLGRLLDHGKHIDYVFITVFAAWPMLHAMLIEAHRTDNGFDGYWTRENWTLLVVLLPLALFLFRWAMKNMAPVSSPWPPPTIPAIVDLVETEKGKQKAYQALRGALLVPGNVIVALLITVAVQMADMRQLVGFYLADPVGICGAENGAPSGERCATQAKSSKRIDLRIDGFSVEKDWSVMFVDKTGVGKWSNLALNVSAYLVQFVLIFMGFLVIVLTFRHNLFFLKRIYQRRRVPVGAERDFIHIDLEDDDKCFGFRRANEAFNTQIMAVGAAAVYILFTRFKNVSPGSGLLPDAGQWLSVFGWLTALAMVALPVTVKLLPRLPLRGAASPPATITAYLKEFLSDEVWPVGSDPSREEIDGVAARFAENAFWPTGNIRARQLFFLSFWVFFVALVPDPRAIETMQTLPPWSRYVAWGVSGCLAWGATWIVFALLRGMLKFVDERLVEPPEHPVAERVIRRRKQIPINLFISYRRDETKVYAGRLRDSLSSCIDRKRIFLDIDTIASGTDFPGEIEKAIGSAQAMIVLIGPQWLELQDDDGRPRIQDPTDFVHQEVALGLDSGITVFPVLVNGAQMPPKTQLPDQLTELARRNACELSDSRWAYDVERLIDDIEKLRLRKTSTSA